MSTIVARLILAEDGAVSVDWVVLTAAIVGLGFAVISSVATGTTEHSSAIGERLSSQTIVEY
jgi:Flp pilus assembly pilin Flp